MLDLKSAILAARNFATAELGVQNLLVEEIKSRPDYFEITLSFPHRLPDSIFVNPLAKGLRQEEREYKTFEVLKETGEVSSMSIRTIS